MNKIAAHFVAVVYLIAALSWAVAGVRVLTDSGYVPPRLTVVTALFSAACFGVQKLNSI